MEKPLKLIPFIPERVPKNLKETICFELKEKLNKGGFSINPDTLLELSEIIAEKENAHKEEIKKLKEKFSIDPMMKISTKETVKKFILSKHSAFSSREQNILEEKRKNKSENPKKPFGIMMIDIDNFKKINDTYGHHAGDIVLKEIAKIIKNNIRSNPEQKIDMVGRWGGDEIMIIIEGEEKNILGAAKRILKTIRKTNIKYENEEIQTTVSVGIASYHENLEKMYKNVDKALFMAKGDEKNQVKKEIESGNLKITTLETRKTARNQIYHIDEKGNLEKIEL